MELGKHGGKNEAGIAIQPIVGVRDAKDLVSIEERMASRSRRLKRVKDILAVMLGLSNPSVTV